MFLCVCSITVELTKVIAKIWEHIATLKSIWPRNKSNSQMTIKWRKARSKRSKLLYSEVKLKVSTSEMSVIILTHTEKLCAHNYAKFGDWKLKISKSLVILNNSMPFMDLENLQEVNWLGQIRLASFHISAINLLSTLSLLLIETMAKTTKISPKLKKKTKQN